MELCPFRLAQATNLRQPPLIEPSRNAGEHGTRGETDMELATRSAHSGYDNNCHYHIVRRNLADASSSEDNLMTIASYDDALEDVASEDEAKIPGFLDLIERVGYVVLPDATYVAIVDCTSTECPWVCEVIDVSFITG